MFYNKYEERYYYYDHDYTSDEYRYDRRTYEEVCVSAILNSLGRVEVKYTREMKSSSRAWQSDSCGSAEVSTIRTESIYEAYSEYASEREYW